MTVTLYHGDCQAIMPTLPANSIDSIVCDPPYGLSFMGKDWDYGVPGVHFWEAALRVAKPGAHLLAFGGDRTHHRMMVAIEDAGWEIRTCLYWLFGSGFPKSLDVSKQLDRMAGAEREVIGNGKGRTGNRVNNHLDVHGDDAYEWPGNFSVTAPATDAAKQWAGWGTALKPAAEIIVMARKPLSEPTIVANVLRWGTGGINVDASRVATGIGETTVQGGNHSSGGIMNGTGDKRHSAYENTQGRWPANLILSEDAAALLDEMSGERPNGYRVNPSTNKTTWFGAKDGSHIEGERGYADTGGASRFFLRVAPDDDEPLRMFYCGKASKRDRDEGLEGMEETERKGESVWAGECPQCGCRMMLNGKPTCGHGETRWVQGLPRRNHHPTVKPTDLMRWLVRLVTPPGGTVLDPFMGSGSTGKAAVLEGFNFVGIELESEYLEIARKRIEHAERTKAQMQPALLEVAG